MNIEFKTIEVYSKGNFISFNFDQVSAVEIHEHKGLGLYEFDFDYAKYIMEDGQYFVINNFMNPNYLIPEGLEPIIKKKFLPIISRSIKLN